MFVDMSVIFLASPQYWKACASQYLKLNLTLVDSVPWVFFFSFDFFCGQFMEENKKKDNLAFHNPNSDHCSTLRYMIFTVLKAIKTILFVKC